MKKRSLFWGSLIILFAVSLLASGFNVFQEGPSIIRLTLTLLLFVASISSLSPLNFFGVLMPLSFALILNVDYLNIAVQTWPVIAGTFFLALGLTLLFKRRKISFFGDFKEGSTSSSKSGQTVRGESIRVESNFNSSSRYVQGDNVRHANLENNFGNLNVYFDQVTFDPNGATIKVDCNFGNMNLFLPSNIKINNNIESSLASVDQAFHDNETDGPMVYLEGDVSFGKVDIRFI